MKLNNMILFQKFIYFVSVSFSLWNLKVYENSLQHISRLTMKLPLWHTLQATTRRGHWTIKLELLKALWFATCLFPIDLLYFKSILVLLFTQSPSPVWHKRVKASKLKNLSLCFRISLSPSHCLCLNLIHIFKLRMREKLGALRYARWTPKKTCCQCRIVSREVTLCINLSLVLTREVKKSNNSKNNVALYYIYI